jgi:hypothetical protein
MATYNGLQRFMPVGEESLQPLAQLLLLFKLDMGNA